MGTDGPSTTSRRAFLAGAAVLAVAGPASAEEGGAAPPSRALPKRAFGRTGVEVTAVGLGCFPLGALPAEDDGVALVRRALDGGLTYLDTAPSYSDGRSETRVGLAVRGRPRDSYFLATKTHTRSASAARRDVEESLGRLGVDRIDLVQVHAVKDAADLEAVLAPKGPLSALVKAREEGLVRFVGVTGHADPATMRSTFERWEFDSVLFPLNCVDPHHLSFVEGTLPAAAKKGLARVAMKVLASGNLPKQGVDAEKCLRYAVGLDVSVAIVGCARAAEVDLALSVASDPHPLSAEETRALLAQTFPHRARLEWYKRS